MRRLASYAIVPFVPALFASCQHVRLLRPRVPMQLDPDIVRLLDQLSTVEDPKEAMVARLYAHGGLSHARLGTDGVFRDEGRDPRHEDTWRPAIIVMERGGELELDFANEDEALRIAPIPSNGHRRMVEPPVRQRRTVRLRLDRPGC